MEDERLMLWLFYLGLLGIAGFIVVDYLNAASTDILFRQEVLASNLALIHDSLDDGFYFKYEIKGNYTIEFDTTEECKVNVIHKDFDSASSFNCIKTRFDGNDLITFENPEYIIFEVKEERLNIRKI